MTAVLVALAGGLGAAIRLVVDGSVRAALVSRVPQRVGIGLVIVNVTGSFALGVLTAATDPGTVRTVLGVGLLGGYTTFSSASLDSARLALSGRGGAAVLHATGTATACVAAAALGALVV